MKYTHISLAERKRISNLRQNGNSVRQIAKELGRSASSISREIKRNESCKIKFFRKGVWHIDKYLPVVIDKYIYSYDAIKAEKKSKERENNSHKPYKMKGVLLDRILILLYFGVSPELIAGRLKLIRNIDISYNTIYNYIYNKKHKHLPLWRYLDKAHPKRRSNHKRQGNYNKSNIKDRVSISQRPEYVNDRSTFGHWEGDMVESKRGNSGGLHTERERKTRFMIVRKINDKTQETTANAMLDIFASMPDLARQTLTLDNGAENHKHYVLHELLDMNTYFCHPYSSFERGTNENGNGLIRKFFPKGTDFSKVTDDEIQEMVDYWNNRPMKCLGYRTPQEAYTQEMQLNKL
jgi:IS30 family transposase